MRAVVTRVRRACVTVEGRKTGEIGNGFLILLGIRTGDGEKELLKLVGKITGLRVFEDPAGKMNLSLGEVGGDLLVVSQFTLYGNCKRGRRPDFFEAAKPESAMPLYELFIAACKNRGFRVESGVFGAHMEVTSVNSGPVTLLLDTEQL